MWEFRQKRSRVKICYYVLTLPVAMLLLHSATVLCSNSYYTLVASIFLVSAASCKAICGVASVTILAEACFLAKQRISRQSKK